MAFRVLFRFSKEGEARFLSHHDLIRLFERALRRAELPVRMTEGFNPHPKFAILSALPLGLEGDEEALEVHFDRPIPATEALERLARQLPPGISAHSASPIEPGAALVVVRSRYRVVLPEGVELREADVDAFLARSHSVVERRNGRKLDIRPAIADLRLEGRVLHFEVVHGQRGTPRPAEVLEAVAGRPAPPTLRVRRTRLDVQIVSKR